MAVIGLHSSVHQMPVAVAVPHKSDSQQVTEVAKLPVLEDQLHSYSYEGLQRQMTNSSEFQFLQHPSPLTWWGTLRRVDQQSLPH